MSGDQAALAVDVEGLVKRFGDKTAVAGVDLKIPAGQVWGFLGPNGSGKTTTIRMICGLLRPSAGSGRCLGYDIRRDADAIRFRTGYMTQKFSFWTDLTIRENLEFVARLYDLDDLACTVDNTLHALDLHQRQTQLAGDLSGGWKQRMALAAITMHKPRLLLLDEPTAGVDPQARREFWDEIHRLTSTMGVTALVSTHYMDEAERCDKVVYLAQGRKITEGSVGEIVGRSGLITFRAEGPDTRRLSAAFEGQPGVDHVAYFGSALHVSGRDRKALIAAVGRAQQPSVSWEEIRPTLEDAFIALSEQQGSDERFAA
jgi:ABC-2 type transport system ATP-binding protein